MMPEPARRSTNHNVFKGDKPDLPPVSSQKRQKLTHFLCLPLLTCSSTPQLAASIAHLRDVVKLLEGAGLRDEKEKIERNSGEDSGSIVPESAFRPLGTLHLTLGVMSLPDAERVAGALKLLKSLDLEKILRDSSAARSQMADNSQPVLAPSEFPKSCAKQEVSSSSPEMAPTQPLTICLRGLHTFKDADPSRVTILHTAPEDATSRLLPFCQRIVSIFQEAGFLVMESGRKRDLTLHATLINTVYSSGGRENRGRRPAGRGQNRYQVRRPTIDARELMAIFNDETHACHRQKSSYQTQQSESIAEGENRSPMQTSMPFTFASDIHISRLQICEMGARKPSSPSSSPFSSSSSAKAARSATAPSLAPGPLGGHKTHNSVQNLDPHQAIGLGAVYRVIGEQKIVVS